MMNSRGILRSSPTKKRNLSAHLINTKQSNQNVRLIDHNHVCESVFSGFEEKPKYNVCEVNTTKRVARKLEHLKKLHMQPTTGPVELSPRTKVIVTEKVSNDSMQIEMK